MLDILHSHFAIADEDTDETVRDKIAGRLLRLAPESGDLLPVIFEALGVPDPDHPLPDGDAAARQHELLRALKLLLPARGRGEPTVQLLEDLQWFDAASDALLAGYVEAIAGARLLLVVNLRTDYRADWMRQSHYQQIALRPLEHAAVGELLDELLGDDPSLATLPPLIRERTRGNPFFVEEMIRSLVDSGNLEGARGGYHLVKPVDVLAIPATVEAMLAARIDRLGEDAKAVLQSAAVIGKQFSESIATRVALLPETDVGPILDALVRAEFLYELAAHPEREFAFRHPLTQETAYRSQLTERRAHTHAAVARALEALHADTVGRYAGLIAHHWEAANQPREAWRWRRRAALRVTRIQMKRGAGAPPEGGSPS